MFACSYNNCVVPQGFRCRTTSPSPRSDVAVELVVAVQGPPAGDGVVLYLTEKDLGIITTLFPFERFFSRPGSVQNSAIVANHPGKTTLSFREDGLLVLSP